MIFAIPEATETIPINPKIAATSAMIKKINAQRNIINKFWMNNSLLYRFNFCTVCFLSVQHLHKQA